MKLDVIDEILSIYCMPGPKVILGTQKDVLIEFMLQSHFIYKDKYMQIMYVLEV